MRKNVYANIVTHNGMEVLHQSCINTLFSPFRLLAKCMRQTIQQAILRLFAFKSSSAPQYDSPLHQQIDNFGRGIREFIRKGKKWRHLILAGFISSDVLLHAFSSCLVGNASSGHDTE